MARQEILSSEYLLASLPKINQNFAELYEGAAGSASVAWADVLDKPATYPSSWPEVSGKPASYPSTWETVSNKPASYPAEWSGVSGKPAAFVPSAHKSSHVTGAADAIAPADIGAAPASAGMPSGGTENQYIRRNSDGSAAWSSLPLLNGHDYGVTAGGDVTAAFQALANAIPAGGAQVVIPPGAYTLSSDIALTGNYLTVVAWGCRFYLTGSAQVGFDLNKNAAPDESGRTSNVRWFGGYFWCSTTADANSNVGIRARGITRGCIKGVYGTAMGDCLIDYSAIDGFHLEDVHGFNNRRHIRVPAYSTIAGNPQSYSIQKCGFGHALERSISIEKMANNVSIRDCYFSGKDAIVISTGNASVASRQVLIETCTFEQAGAGQFFIRTEDPSSKTLRALTIRSCDFNNTDPRILDAVSVEGLVFDGNHVMSSQAGMIRLNAACKNVQIGVSNVWASLASLTGQAIEFACPRSEIQAGGMYTQGPVPITGWNGTTRSTSTGTIDMSVSASSSYPKLLPPKAWIINARVQESTSSVGPRHLILTQNSTDQLSTAPTASCGGLPDNTRAHTQLIVPADVNGDMYYQVVAAGTTSNSFAAVLGVSGAVL